MGMDDTNLFEHMALPVVLNPILEKIEQDRGSSDVRVLRATLAKAEDQCPGFSYFFIQGILEKGKVKDRVDMSEAILLLEGTGEQEDVKLLRPEPAFQTLNSRANNLKTILGRIPAEIFDRKKFLETIKDIASAIKNLLDAVNEVFNHVHSQEGKHSLEQRKRDFVKYSKRFSTTLKEFFKDNRKREVYLSANYLIHQTNLIMGACSRVL